MRVLILHQHFNTAAQGGPLRSYYLAKALLEAGIHPVVITARQQKEYTLEQIEGIEVHYLPVPYNNRFRFYPRVLSFIRYAFQAVRVARKIPRTDLCYAISVPLTVGITAMWMKKMYKLKFIFEVGDLWPDAPVELGFIRNVFLKRILYDLERTIYYQAESIVALSPMIRKAIQRKVGAKVVHLIPNMSDTAFYEPGPKVPALEKKFGVERKFVVSYTGAIGYANGLDYYIECARASAKAELPIHFLMCGDGAMAHLLQRVARNQQLSNLTFIPFQSREGVRDVLNVTDAAFISYRPSPILETGSPNKYFDALAAGKMIVINFGGWIKDEVEQMHCGVYVDPKNPNDFVNKMKSLFADKSIIDRYSHNARALAIGKYERKKLSHQFVSIVRHHEQMEGTQDPFKSPMNG